MNTIFLFIFFCNIYSKTSQIGNQSIQQYQNDKNKDSYENNFQSSVKDKIPKENTQQQQQEKFKQQQQQ